MRGVLVLGCLAGLSAMPGCQQASTPGADQSGLAQPWPPVVGQLYPDLTLTDIQGAKIPLSKFKGSILLVEPIGMSCPACNAWSGAGDGQVPGFRGVKPQPGLKSIDACVSQYAGGIRPDDPNVTYVSLILYNPSGQSPTLADAQAWAEHFRHASRPNHVVLFADAGFLGKASYDMIPGFHLVDAGFVLRSDATGHKPRNDLYTELLPLLGKLVREKKS